MDLELLLFFHMSVMEITLELPLVNDGFNIILVLCACNSKEVEVMQWRIEVDVLKKDMDVVQQRCHQLVMLLVHYSTTAFCLSFFILMSE